MSDTSTASELLITIKTLLDSKGLDAAKKELDKIISAGKKAGETNKDQAKEAKLLQEILGQLGRRQSEVRDVAEGMANATKGGTAGFFGMAKAAHNLWQIIQNSNPWIRLASVILAAGAAAVAVAQTMKGEGDKLKESNKAAQDALDDWEKAVDKINKKTFEALHAELKKITDEYTTASASAERLYRIQTMLSKSKEEKELADLELEALNTQMPEHTKAMKALEIKRRFEESRFASEEAALKDREEREMSTVITKNRKANALEEDVSRAAGDYQGVWSEAKKSGIEEVLTPAEMKDRSFGADTRKRVEEMLKKSESEMAALKWQSDAAPFNQELQKELDAARAGVLKIRSTLGMLQHLQGAAEREKMAIAKFDMEIPGLETEITSGRGNLQDISAQREDLGIRRQTAAARYKAQYSSVAYVNDNPGDQPNSRDVSGLQAGNRYEFERLTSSVLSQGRDADGSRFGGSRGVETRQNALLLLRNAVSRTVAKSGDTKEDAQVIEDLVKALEDNGTVMTMGYDQLRIGLQNLEKNTAEMRQRLGASESREKAASGLN